MFSELGISRAAVAIIAYLMKRNKCTLKVSHTPSVAMVTCGILAMSTTNSRQDRQRFLILSGFRGRWELWHAEIPGTEKHSSRKEIIGGESST